MSGSFHPSSHCPAPGPSLIRPWLLRSDGKSIHSLTHSREKTDFYCSLLLSVTLTPTSSSSSSSRSNSSGSNNSSRSSSSSSLSRSSSSISCSKTVQHSLQCERILLPSPNYGTYKHLFIKHEQWNHVAQNTNVKKYSLQSLINVFDIYGYNRHSYRWNSTKKTNLLCRY